jgi:hypothetical protein
MKYIIKKEISLKQKKEIATFDTLKEAQDYLKDLKKPEQDCLNEEELNEAIEHNQHIDDYYYICLNISDTEIEEFINNSAKDKYKPCNIKEWRKDIMQAFNNGNGNFELKSYYSNDNTPCYLYFE